MLGLNNLKMGLKRSCYNFKTNLSLFNTYSDYTVVDKSLTNIKINERHSSMSMNRVFKHSVTNEYMSSIRQRVGYSSTNGNRQRIGLVSFRQRMGYFSTNQVINRATSIPSLHLFAPSATRP